MDKDNSVTKPSTARDSIKKFLSQPLPFNDNRSGFICEPFVSQLADQILALWPKVLGEEEIQSLLKELRRNSGGKILMAVDIYRAISQATVKGE